MKFWVKIFIFAGLIGRAGFVFGQDSQRAVLDSTANVHHQSSRDSWLGQDKFDHALVSAGLVAAQFYILHQEFEVESRQSRQMAAGGALALGIAKEIYDGISRRGTPSLKDLLADVVGVGLAVGIVTP